MSCGDANNSGYAGASARWIALSLWARQADSARVTNAGRNAGDEVVELYLTHVGIEGAPIRSLAGFQRIHLERGASQTVTFSLSDRDLSIVDAEGVRRIVPGDDRVWIGGGQPVTGPGQSQAAGAETNFRIASAKTLPE